MNFEKDFLKWIGEHHPELNIHVMTVTKPQISYRAFYITGNGNGSGYSPLLPVAKYAQLYHTASYQQVYAVLLADYERTVREKVMPDFSRKFILDNVTLKMIPMEGNAAYLEDKPYFTWLDLAVIPVIHLKLSNKMNGTAPIRNDALKAQGISEKELFTAAKENAQNVVMSLNDMILTRTRSDFGEEAAQEMAATMAKDTVPLYVITNKSTHDGASAVLDEDILQRIANLLDGDYYLLPSSIHEFLAAPAYIEPAFLQEMLASVNDKIVDEEDRLGYHIYHYNRERRAVSIVMPPEEDLHYGR